MSKILVYAGLQRKLRVDRTAFSDSIKTVILRNGRLFIKNDNCSAMKQINSLKNCYNSTGTWPHSGSGGFLSDLTFYGGGVAEQFGDQYSEREALHFIILLW